MKLHLTASLRAALLCALCLNTSYGADSFYKEIGTFSGILESGPASTLTVKTTGDVTLNDQVVGYKKSDGTLAGYSDFYSTPTKNWQVTGTLTINGASRVALGGQKKVKLLSNDEYTGLIADKVVVNGSGSANNVETYNAYVREFEVNSGKVSIHNSGNSKSGNTSISTSSYQYDSKQVRILETLTVNGGSVIIGNSGGNSEANDSHCQTGFGNGKINESSPADSTISSSWIKQGVKEDSTGGKLTVAGKSVSVGGLNIVQNAGTMSISDGNYHIIADNGVTADSSVTQNGAGILTIGCVLAENSYKDKVSEYTAFGDAQFHVKQTGSGEINMNGGIVFNYNSDSKAKSSFTQTGNGTINLSGTFGRNDAASADKWAAVYFDITQNDIEQKGVQTESGEKGGVINLKENATISAATVSQAATYTLNIEEGATMTANQVNVGGVMNVAGNLELVDIEHKDETSISKAGLTVSGTLNVTGSLTLNGATIKLVIDDLSQIAEQASAYALALTDGNSGNALINVADGATISANENAKFELIFTANAVNEIKTNNLDALNLELISGVGSDALKGFQITLSTEEGAGATVEELFGSESPSYSFSDFTNGTGVKIEVQGNAAVPEPTTATLSLLALAGLCARRRRR